MKKRKGVTVRLYEKPCYEDGGLVAAAEATRQGGRWGDEILIHVNPEEFAQMQQMWGEPTLNPHTGLPEYGFLSKLWKGIKKALKVVAPIALNVFAPGAGTALGSMLGVGATAGRALLGAGLGALSGGGKGALIGGLTGGIGGGAGLASKLGMGQGALQTALGDALLGGAMGKATGGSFGDSALLGGLSSLALPALNNAIAKTGFGQKLGMAEVPSLMSPQAQAEALQEYDPIYSRHVPTGIDAPASLDGNLEEVLVQGSRIGAPKAGTASLLSPVAFTTNEASTGANAIETPDVGAVDPGIAIESAPAEGSFLQKAFGYATKNPLQTATALMMLQGLTQDKPDASDLAALTNATQQRGFGDPLPQFNFNRQLQPSLTDYYTYGRRPEVSFYLNNQQPTPGMAAGGLAMLSMCGGGKPAMGGGGKPAMGGRSDTIDARLSEGEYVVDAETVALLGDGSTDAGAKKLDALRKNIRTHKGKALAKGKISPNAKPDAALYMRARA